MSNDLRFVSSFANGTGDGLSPSTAWTAQQGFSLSPAGAECRIMDDGVYAPSSSYDLSGVQSSANSPQIFVSATPLGDAGGETTIVGVNLSNNDGLVISQNNSRFIFKGITFEGINNSSIVGLNAATANVVLEKCKFIDCIKGLVLVNLNSRATIDGTLFKNVSRAISEGISGRSVNTYVYNSIFEDCSTVAVYAGERTVIERCIFVRCGNAITSSANASMSDVKISTSVFINNVLNGITISTHDSSERILIQNNIFHKNGEYAIKANDINPNRIIMKNNCFFNNTAGNIDNINGLWGEGHVLADPLFEDDTLGIEDLRLKENSPCKNAGYLPLGVTL